ncbi:RecT family recombinase [Segetibacter aerophilus]|uniref:Recombinase RecT n=1 Tax=Segetibacter aerophilus TaxID=670293 RepID=A0A512B9V9_9BACT|nr:RecT family recombinase [Segetibacter aerophilus]GEO08723.1 hypothetical protein SAE01_12190 [Segetibacter aerophilus]
METTQVQQQPQVNYNLATKPETIVETTLRRVAQMQNDGELKLPQNYSAPNALRAAWLILQEAKNMDKRPVLEVCTKESIAYALLNMVLQGLNPIKRQCSFIAYGNKLNLQREYQGTIAIAKRVGLKSVVANAIFDGDEFTYEVGEDGRKKVTKHVQSIDSLGNAIKGAYAIVTMSDGTTNVEVMNMRQIQQAWQQGPTKGQSPAHKNFPDQMACKTVIGRSLKTIINSSDDAALFEDDEPLTDVHTANVQNTIEENGNKTEIGFDEDMHSLDQEQPAQEPEQQPEGQLSQQQTTPATVDHGGTNGTQIKAPF